MQVSGSGWRRWVRRHRRGLAGAAAAASVLVLGLALAPADPVGVPVVVAARDLAAGDRLSADDVTITDHGGAALPRTALVDPSAAVGQILSSTVVAGEVLTEARFVRALAGTAPASATRVAMPVRFADDAATRLITPGQRIDVLAAAGPDSESPDPVARLVAADVPVLAVLGADQDSAGPLGGSAVGESAGPVVVLDVDRPTAVIVAGSQAVARMSFALRPDG